MFTNWVNILIKMIQIGARLIKQMARMRGVVDHNNNIINLVDASLFRKSLSLIKSYDCTFTRPF